MRTRALPSRASWIGPKSHYRGAIFQGFGVDAERWRCGHDHSSRMDASACAEEALRLVSEYGCRLARTRPDYDLACDRCQSPIWFDVSIPTPLWNAVIGSPNLTLCLLCIDDAFAAAGCENVPARLYFAGKALSLRETEDR